MSESKSEGPRVVDRRRFDPDGTPRSDEEFVTSQQQSGPTSTSTPTQEEPQPSAEPNVAGPGEDVQTLKSQLEAAQKRIDELARAIQAGDRDREAFKQRVTRERERMIDVEKGNIAQTLLETVDELDLSLQSAAGAEGPLVQGVRMIRDGIVARLGTLGVERVELVGRPYDPNLAEAVDMEITPNEDEDQKVVAEMRPAYRMKERVIRPGRVKVAKYIAPAQA